ncbi:MAG: alpha/beta hydrolase [Proteobacteria bacterium]|nr:MAG: alpha/beta hydrolase [Pseudomonadota bacterium]
MSVIDLDGKIMGEGLTAVPVVVLHGLFGSWENLGVVARALARDYPVHALDLRNHGRSPHTEVMNYQVMAEDVLAYANRHGLTRFHLLGHSMGGKVAMQIALLEPRVVESLIVADIAPVAYAPDHELILKGLMSLPLDSLASRSDADRYLEGYVPELPVRQFLLKNLVKTGAGRFAWRMNLEAINLHYLEIIGGLQSNRPFTGPTLFIKGGSSDYIQAHYETEVLRLFPSAGLRVIPKAGHWLHAEKPELFIQVCKRFLNKVTVDKVTTRPAS